MSEKTTPPEKNQTERLIDFLEGQLSINFLEAFNLLGIQDLRKRLSEVRDLGYRLKSRERLVERRIPYLGPCQNLPMLTASVTHWSLDPVLQPGHYVRIEAPAVFPTGRHPLKGSFGVILGKENHQYIVGDIYGQPVGRFRHRDLHLMGEFPKGARVGFTGNVFSVMGFEPGSGDYIVQDKDGASYLLSPELLRRV